MADILRNIMLLNDPPIIEYLLSDAAFYWVTGIFEYDRSLRERGNYRQFFRQANLRSVLRLSTEVSSGSTLLFRLRFVKDIMLHPTIDEPGVMSINSMIAFTSGELCYQVLVDKDYMRRLFAVVLSMCPLPASAASAQPVMVPPLPGSQSDTPTELDAPAEQAVEDLARPIDGLRFFRELIALSKCIALEKRIEYYKTFLSHFRTEFFHLVKFVLAGASYSLRARALVPRSAADALEESVQASLRQHPAFPLFQHPVAVNRTPTGKDKVLILLESTDFFRGAEVAEALSIVSEILAAITCVCPAIVRQEILAGPAPAWGPTDAPSQDNSSPSASSWMQSSLLFLIIDLVLNAHDLSTVELLGDCLKALFDFESRPLVSNVVGTKTEKDKLLPLFYEHYATWLLAPFLGQNNPAQPLPHSYYHSRGMRWLGPCLAFAPLQPSSAVTASRRVIFDLLGLCACTHSYRAKYFLIRANYVSSIVARTFACRTARTLHLCAVKFIRAILRVKDEFYHRHLEKVDALRPMFNAFKAVATKDNLFTSAVHDLVDTIRTENITTLVEYIVERYGHCFEEVRHVEVFDGLRLRYDQMRDREINAPSSEAESADVGGGLSGTSGGSTQVDGTRSKRAIATVRNRDLDAEDDYFFGDDDSFADLSQSYPRSNGEANHYSNKAGSNAASSGTNRSSNSVGSGGSTGNGASNGQHLPSADFLDSLRHKHVPTKPPSPPHYSLCMHGSPLDGGASLGISEGILEPTGQRSQQDSPQGRGSSGGMGGGRVLDLLSQYDDDSPVKAAQGDDDDFPPSTLPPLKPRFEDDDSAPLSLLKKKRPVSSEYNERCYPFKKSLPSHQP